MKKVIFALALVFSTLGFIKAVELNADSKSVTSIIADNVHCYTMTANGMMVCVTGSPLSAMKTAVTLANGTTISTIGVITVSRASKGTQLLVGQCVDAAGVIASYAKHN